MKSHKGDFVTVMRTYRRTFRFFLLFHLLILPVICHQEVYCFSLTMYIKQRHILPYLCARHSIARRTIPGKEYSSNCEFTSFVLGNIFHTVHSFLLIHLLLLQSGNVHPNPGPSSVSSDTRGDSPILKHFYFIYKSLIIRLSLQNIFCL